jgi:hypothetical protein
MGQGYHRSMRKLSALIGVISLLALVTACGVSVGPHHTLSAPSVANEISAQLKSDYGIDPPPAVSCPDGIEASKGTTFVCTTVLDDQHVDLDGTVTGSNGRYEVVPRDTVIRIDALESYLTGKIRNTAGATPASVDCGTKQVAVVAAVVKITCLATFPRPATPVTVTAIVDKYRNVTYSVQKAAA